MMPKQQGFTLLEALIALLLISIGLLGVASMQLSSVRATYNADWRGQAALLIQDLADRMRANLDNARSGGYADGGTPNALSTADRAAWDALLLEYLPSGTGTVECDNCAAGVPYTITVAWDADRDGVITVEGEDDPEHFLRMEVTP